jgi:hypothetical protein
MMRVKSSLPETSLSAAVTSPLALRYFLREASYYSCLFGNEVVFSSKAPVLNEYSVLRHRVLTQ